MNRNLRKCFGLLCGIILYFTIHEGAHLLFALRYGVFRELKFMGLGMQVAITDRNLLADLEFALMNIAGAVATLAVAYLLIFLTKKICSHKNAVFRACGYYTTLALLFTDPIYLSVLYRFFGGGDMNGILYLGLPEGMVCLIFAVIGLFNGYLFIRYVYPLYKKAFQRNGVASS